MGVGSDWDSKGSGQSKVRQLDDSMDVDQEVLGLEVAMEDTVGVAELDPLQNLVGVALKGEKGEREDNMSKGRVRYPIMRKTINFDRKK